MVLELLLKIGLRLLNPGLLYENVASHPLRNMSLSYNHGPTKANSLCPVCQASGEVAVQTATP